MTWYQVTHDGTLWSESSDEEEVRVAFAFALGWFPTERVVLRRWYTPPAPVGHWIEEEASPPLTPAKE